MINRAALVIKYRQPFLRWLNQVENDPDVAPLSLDEANSDNQVYLIDMDDADTLEAWLDLNHELLFENELEVWCEDESLWPGRRDRAAFDEWFTVECHTVLYDAGSDALTDDGS